MKRRAMGTSINDRMWFAAVILVAGVIASGSVLVAQTQAERTARAVDQAQRSGPGADVVERAAGDGLGRAW